MKILVVGAGAVGGYFGGRPVQAQPFRNNPGPNESALVTQFNDSMFATPH